VKAARLSPGRRRDEIFILIREPYNRLTEPAALRIVEKIVGHQAGAPQRITIEAIASRRLALPSNPPNHHGRPDEFRHRGSLIACLIFLVSFLP